MISAIGTAIFNLISFGEGVIEGPPKALPGSGVTVKRSTLTDRRPGRARGLVLPGVHTTPRARRRRSGSSICSTASWPGASSTTTPRPTWPNRRTASSSPQRLRRTSSPPTACGSAATRCTAPSPTCSTIPTPHCSRALRPPGTGRTNYQQQVVLVGHSLGGGLVIDTARYMAAERGERRVELQARRRGDARRRLVHRPGADPRTSSTASRCTTCLPTPYPWNLFGTMDAALAQVRPGPTSSHGAQMLFGFHSDAMVGGNPLIQFGAYLLTGLRRACQCRGFSDPRRGLDQRPVRRHDRDLPDRSTASQGKRSRSRRRSAPPSGSSGRGKALVTSLAQDVTGAFFGLLGHINFATDVDPGLSRMAAVGPIDANQFVTCPPGAGGSPASCSPALAA